MDRSETRRARVRRGRGDGQRDARGNPRRGSGGVQSRRARACVPRSRDRISRVRTRGGALLLADAGDRGDARRRRATRRNPADWLSPIGALRREARRRERREARDGRHLCERTRLCHVSVASAVLPVGDDVARTVVSRAIFPLEGSGRPRPLDLRTEDLRTAGWFFYPQQMKTAQLSISRRKRQILERPILERRLFLFPCFARRPASKPGRPTRTLFSSLLARAPLRRGRQAMGPIDISGGEVPSGLRRASTTLKNAPGASPLRPSPSSTALAAAAAHRRSKSRAFFAANDPRGPTRDGPRRRRRATNAILARPLP